MIRRSHHWTDTPLEGRRRRRTIGNWLNYCEPGGEWRPSSPAVQSAQGAPPNWAGAFDFSFKSEEAPLQCFLRDAADVGNRAMVGVRMAGRPGSWLNFKALDCSSVDAVVVGPAVWWPDLWPQCDLRYRPGRHKLVKEIICHGPGHPETFAFSLRTTPGHSIVFAGGGARVLDDGGDEVLRLNPPWAHDSSTVHPTPGGHKPIGVTLHEGEPRVIGGRAHQVVELALDPEDLEGAVYPVTIDPTVQITGTTDIEDTSLISANDNNYGGSDTIYTGQASAWRGLVRIAEISSIPAGTITALKMIAYASTASSFEPLVAHIVTDANNWVEGTLTGVPQVGSACWMQSRYSEQDWAGSVGCGTSGVDYDADASPPEHFYTTGWHTFDLKPEWATAWRNAVREPNGIRFVQKAPALGTVYLLSTERVGYELYFEIDYEEGAAASIAAMSLPRRIHE